jgi:antitoxin ParD1/3/4
LAEGRYSSTSDYVRALMRRDQDYEDKRRKLLAAIDAALASGVSDRDPFDYLDEMRAKLRSADAGRWSDAQAEAAKARGRDALANEPRAIAARYDREAERIVVDLASGATFAFAFALGEAGGGRPPINCRSWRLRMRRGPIGPRADGHGRWGDWLDCHRNFTAIIHLSRSRLMELA